VLQSLCAIIFIGYMFVVRIHEFDCDKCDVWLSCCVLVIFVKMGQKRRSMILIILNGLMKLVC
jgi:hypothetical protein